MRQFAAVAVGAWYYFVLLISFTAAIRSLSNSPSGEHYLLEVIGGVAASFAAATLAGLAAKGNPFIPPIAIAIPTTIILLGLHWLLAKHGGLDLRLEPVVWGWAPRVFTLNLVGFLLTLLGSFIGAFEAHEILSREPEQSAPGTILGVSSWHWIWLWIPICFWAYLFTCSFYIGWLSFATGWYGIFHPSLWFKGYIGPGMGGFVLLSIAESFFWVGIGGSMRTLETRHGVGRKHIALKFLGYGVGLAILTTGFFLRWAFFGFADLVSRSGNPWWAL